MRNDREMKVKKGLDVRARRVIAYIVLIPLPVLVLCIVY